MTTIGQARTGVVVDTSTLSDGRVTVRVGGGDIFAAVTDMTMTTLAMSGQGTVDVPLRVGAVVTLLPLMGSWEVVSIRSPGGVGGSALGSELIANPSFDFGLDGWGSFFDYEHVANDPLMLSSENVFGSEWSACVASSVTDELDHYLIGRPFMVDPGVNHRMSAWISRNTVEPPPDYTVRLILLTGPSQEQADILQPNSTPQTVTTITSGMTDQWQLFFDDAVVPQGHGWARVIVHTESAPSEVFTFIGSLSLRPRLT